MIPSDHFVRYYNEVFKALDGLGREHLEAYWRELGRCQVEALGELFRAGGLAACRDYWERIRLEENCAARLTLTGDYFEFRMTGCPSLAKVTDNDAGPFELYCDHCPGWIEPVMEYAGLYPVMDIGDRREPRCLFRVYADPAKAAAFARRRRRPQPPAGP